VPWRWRQYAPPKHWSLSTSPHGVATQNTNMNTKQIASQFRYNCTMCCTTLVTTVPTLEPCCTATDRLLNPCFNQMLSFQQRLLNCKRLTIAFKHLPLLTPRSRVLLKKLIVGYAQVVKKFVVLYGTPRYIHYRVHKCLPPVPVPSQMNPIHIHTPFTSCNITSFLSPTFSFVLSAWELPRDHIMSRLWTDALGLPTILQLF
jgi:hypothetical protein